MGMQEFVKKWNGVSVEDDGCFMSGEAKQFVTQFRNALKKDLPDAEITIKIPSMFRITSRAMVCR